LITTTPFQQPTKKTTKHDTDVIKEKGCQGIPDRMLTTQQHNNKYNKTTLTFIMIRLARIPPILNCNFTDQVTQTAILVTADDGRLGSTSINWSKTWEP
jgi:hypothetical protein